MKLFSLLLKVLVLVATFTAANGQHDTYLKKQNSVVQPTAAPLMTSTIVPKNATNKSKTSTNKPQVKEEISESLPIEVPATVDHQLKAEESKPLAVTGFITANGSIYEVEDKNGIGQIQSRQSPNGVQHICNYGAVLIYSAIPCDQVANVKISEVVATPFSRTQQANTTVENNPKEELEQNNDLAKPNNQVHAKPQRPKGNKKRPNKNPQKWPMKNTHKRPVQNAYKRPNKNGQKKPNKTNKKRPTNRPNVPKRPNKNVQKRPIKNNQKVPNKNNQKRPNTNVNKRPVNNNPPPKLRYYRRWQNVEDDIGDERYFQSRRRAQKIQPVLSYISDYDEF